MLAICDTSVHNPRVDETLFNRWKIVNRYKSSHEQFYAPITMEKYHIFFRITWIDSISTTLSAICDTYVHNMRVDETLVNRWKIINRYKNSHEQFYAPITMEKYHIFSELPRLTVVFDKLGL